MFALIGFMLLACAMLALTVAPAWLNGHRNRRALERWMAAEMTALFIVGTGVVGFAMVAAMMMYARDAGRLWEVALCALGLLAVAPAGLLLRRWARRALATAH